MTTVTASAALTPAAARFAARAITRALGGDDRHAACPPEQLMELEALRDALDAAGFEADVTGVGVHVRADFVLI